MKQIINWTYLLIFLLFNNNRIYASTTKSTPPDMENLPLKNFQKVVSNCEAIREVFDHEGGAAGFTSNCVIKVWNDKDSPTDLKDLTPEQQEKLKTELGGGGGQAQTPNEQSNLDQIKLLQEEAANRHYMCMEAKRSILNHLKLQLPAGLNSCDKINQVLNDLKLSPILEGFINKVSGPMKEIVARIHSIEQDAIMTEADKLEALRKEKSELTRLLDEDCKDEHPSIRFHNIGYLPSPEMQQLKMTLVVTHPDRKVEFFNLPAEGMGPQVDYLRSMTEAAAHHFQVTGQTGPFKAHLMSGPRSEGLAPRVISFVPANKVADASSNSNASATDETNTNTLKSQPIHSNFIDQVNDSNSDQHVSQGQDASTQTIKGPSISDTSTSSSTQSDIGLTEINTPISKYWKSIFDAHDQFASKVKTLTETTDVSTPGGQSRFDLQSKVEKEALDKLLQTATLDLIRESNLADISGTNTAEAIEKRYQDSKALLKTARDYVPTEKKSFLQYLSSSKVKSFPEKMYEFSKDVIKKIRYDALKELKDKRNNNSSDKSTSSDTVIAAKTTVDPKLSKKEELITQFVDSVSKSSQELKEDDLKPQFDSLFNENDLDKIPNIASYKIGNFWKSKERKKVVENKAKMENLLKEVVERLKKIGLFDQSKVVNEVGNVVISEYIRNKEIELKKIEDGIADALNNRKDDIDNFLNNLMLLNGNDSLDEKLIEPVFESSSLFDELKVNEMPNVPFKDISYYTRTIEEKRLKNNDEKRKALLTEVLSQLKNKSFKGMETVKKVGNEYITKLAEPKQAVTSTTNNSNTVGSFWKKIL